MITRDRIACGLFNAFLFLFIGLFQAGTARAGETHPWRAGLSLDAGWQEALVSVPDLDRAIAFYRDAADWALVHRGRVDPAWLEAWCLADGASASEAVLRNPGDATGFLRLVRFEGVDQQVIRSAARAWEPGGHGGLNMRVLDIDAVYGEFQRWGWHGFSDPVTFELDRFTVTEVMMTGFGGEHVALIERSRPPLSGWPTLKTVSRAFNAWAVAADFDAMMDFYLDVLGFEVFLTEHGPSAPTGMNLFGLPHNLVADIPRRLTWVQPNGENEGSLAVMVFDGLEGRNFQNRAHPPNLGLLSLRYPVSDLAGRYRSVKGKAPIVVGPGVFSMPPYGRVSAFTVRDPNGGWLTFFDPATPEVRPATAPARSVAPAGPSRSPKCPAPGAG